MPGARWLNAVLDPDRGKGSSSGRTVIAGRLRDKEKESL